MDVVREQYFDFGIMGDEFGFVLDGVLGNDPALVRQRRPCADVGASCSP